VGFFNSPNLWIVLSGSGFWTTICVICVICGRSRRLNPQITPITKDFFGARKNECDPQITPIREDSRVSSPEAKEICVNLWNLWMDLRVLLLHRFHRLRKISPVAPRNPNPNLRKSVESVDSLVLVPGSSFVVRAICTTSVQDRRFREDVSLLRLRPSGS
jgi:hypothetical protein